MGMFQRKLPSLEEFFKVGGTRDFQFTFHNPPTFIFWCSSDLDNLEDKLTEINKVIIIPFLVFLNVIYNSLLK